MANIDRIKKVDVWCKFSKKKNPPSLKKSYSGYNKMVYFNTFLIKKGKIVELRFKEAYKKKLYYKKL